MPARAEPLMDEFQGIIDDISHVCEVTLVDGYTVTKTHERKKYPLVWEEHQLILIKLL